MRTRRIIASVVVALLSCASCAGDPDDGDGQGGDAGGGEGGGGDGDDGDGDGGDMTCAQVTLEPQCTTAWYGDQECDPANNMAECEWDGGDCCPSTCVGAECGGYGYECRDPAAGGGGMPVPALIGQPCVEAADPFAPDHLQDEVTLLASDDLAGRRPATVGDLTARRYIEEKFRCFGLTPVMDGCYQQPFNDGDGGPTANVLGYLEGSDPSVADEIIVVGGHHDHLGIEAGEIYNGANDNASGTVGVLAVADFMRRQTVAPRRTILFATFGSEEPGLEGSIFYAAHAPDAFPMAKVVYMINLDMLGTYDDADAGNTVDGFGTFAGTPGRDLLDAILEDHPDFVVNKGKASEEEDSDFDPFCAAGIPYVYFATEDACWHEPCDDAARMDYEHMSEILVVTKDILLGLANSDLDLSAVRDDVGCSREND